MRITGAAHSRTFLGRSLGPSNNPTFQMNALKTTLKLLDSTEERIIEDFSETTLLVSTS